MRRYSPGEVPPWRGGAQARDTNLARLHIAQIKSINPDTGLMKVKIRGQELTLDVPVPVKLHIDGAASSWQRYMPSENDFVIIGFDGADQPIVVDHYTWGESASTDSASALPGYVGGYAVATDLREQGVAGFREFVALKRGEFDMRSAGGAYIYGSRGGALRLDAGMASFVLKKNENEIRERAGLTEVKSDTSFIRVGDVKRIIPSADLSSLFIEQVVPGSGKEFWVHLGTAIPGTTTDLPTYELRAGDIRDTLGIPVPAAPISTAAMTETVYTPGGVVPGYTRQVDTAGNAATNALVQNSVTAGAVVSIDAPLVQVGGAAATRFVPYGLELVTVLQSLTAAVTALAAAATGPTNAAAIAAVTAQLAVVTAQLAAAPGTLYSATVMTK